uniref:Ig-like domain-containing protein n=1 Tax=Maylandia zebra TaxID=106582 RepID=A0A3P9B890_9CICH
MDKKIIFYLSLHLMLCSVVLSVPQVEVDSGEESVQLPCKTSSKLDLPDNFSGFIPEHPAVMWTRSDLHPKSLHLQREGRDDLGGQNQRYSGRTSMRPDALDTGDFSLTLRKPTKTDSGAYTCSISDGGDELKVTDIQLQVKGQQQNQNVYTVKPEVQ